MFLARVSVPVPTRGVGTGIRAGSDWTPSKPRPQDVPLRDVSYGSASS